MVVEQVLARSNKELYNRTHFIVVLILDWVE